MAYTLYCSQAAISVGYHAAGKLFIAVVINTVRSLCLVGGGRQQCVGVCAYHGESHHWHVTSSPPSSPPQPPSARNIIFTTGTACHAFPGTTPSTHGIAVLRHAHHRPSYHNTTITVRNYRHHRSGTPLVGGKHRRFRQAYCTLPRKTAVMYCPDRARQPRCSPWGRCEARGGGGGGGWYHAR